MDYHEFLDQKGFVAPDCGVDVEPDNAHLFDFQRDITAWTLRKGKAAIFADCGLGKTIMQLVWAHHICEHTQGRVIVLAPLAVAQQTVREAEKFGVDGVEYCREDTGARITITNYEMMKNFDASKFDGVVLDESSILKSFSSKYRVMLTEAFADTEYKLACTATPAPNDYIEIANHSEFLGIMRLEEVSTNFFAQDRSYTKKWDIKKHAEQDFWKWLCSWAVMVTNPRELGYKADGFDLPALKYHEHVVGMTPQDGFLFAMQAQTLQERIKERSRTYCERAEEAARVIAKMDGPVVVWCALNNESSEIAKLLNGSAAEVRGSDKLEAKEKKLLGFSAGDIRVLVTKPTIAGFGMNWQHCKNVVFLGLSDSYEQFYQAIRRCWRFGQEREVDCHIVIAETEGEVLKNVKRKEDQSNRMRREMIKNMADLTKKELAQHSRKLENYSEANDKGNGWEMHLGDCVEVLRRMPDNSIDFSIFSPPFSSLYVYSDQTRDLGNSKSDEVFYDHYLYFARELYRVMKPGRNFSFHVSNTPRYKRIDGVIGIKDVRGEMVRVFEKAGFVYHSETCIWKDPVTSMHRTKAIGLLYKQLKKDSCMSRQGIPDYLVTMKKWGENGDPVSHTEASFPLERWQKYASPVWPDIVQGQTLQHRSARDEKDEKHICPLQLEVIKRALELWSNPRDLVLSPFAGIGSEGYVAIQQNRRFVGIELKESYYRQAVKNLKSAENSYQEQWLFDEEDDE